MESRPSSTADNRLGSKPLDPIAEEALLRERKPLALQIARRMTRRFEGIAEREDLEQTARLALWQAARRFDPARGCQFDTFAVPTIIGALMHHLRDRTLSMKVPRCWWGLRPRLLREVEVATQILGGDPTVAELATRLGVTEEDVVGAIGVRDLYYPVSLDDPQEWPDGESQTVADRIGAADPLLDGLDLLLLVRHALGSLEPRLREILTLCYYHGQTQLEVGRWLGISQMHVSRLERQALAWLRQELRREWEPEPEAETSAELCAGAL
jgi:RNA polymerase sigma-B factor